MINFVANVDLSKLKALIKIIPNIEASVHLQLGMH